MRFHKNFIENGMVFVEVLQKDSPLTPDKATILLTLIQQECEAQVKIQSELTVLQRIFRKLPEFVESMNVGIFLTIERFFFKIFTPSIDVPNAQKTAYSSLSGSFCEDNQGGESSDVLVGAPTSLNKALSVVPITYTPSPYE